MYDPNKSYTWAKEELFTITGQEFSMILNSLRAVLNTEEAAKYIYAYKGTEILERLMAEGVEKGIVKEMKQSKE